MDAVIECEVRKLLELAASGTDVPADDSVEFDVPILKANDEDQTVTGIVLEPETVDAHGDIYDATVIKQAAYDFLARYNVQTKLGTQHTKFAGGVYELVESYLAPLDMVIGKGIVKAGTWIITVHVLDAKVWKAIKDGKFTGFSIGGFAKAVDLQPKVPNFA